jgi:hypothetical protein
MELAFFTTKELIEELTNRNTFSGVVLQSMQEKTKIDLLGKGWDITYSNLTEKEVSELLAKACIHFEQLNEQE